MFKTIIKGLEDNGQVMFKEWPFSSSLLDHNSYASFVTSTCKLKCKNCMDPYPRRRKAAACHSVREGADCSPPGHKNYSD